MTFRRSRLLGSLAALFGAQGFGYAITFLQVPILTRALSPEGFGVYAFCNLLILLITNLVSYASNNTAILAFRRHAASPLRRSLIFWNQLGAQIFIAIVASLALTIAIALNPAMRHDAGSYALLILFTLANAFYCPWVFSALEHFRLLSRLGMLSRLLGLLIVVVFVHTRDDLVIAVASAVVPNVVVAMLFFAIITRERLVCWIPSNRWQWRRLLVRDFFVAMSTLVVVVQGNAALFIARFTLSSHDYGLLAFADRFRFIAQMVVGTMGLVLFSRYCSARLAGREEAIRAGRLSVAALVGSGAALALAVALFAGPIVALLGGRHFAGAMAPTLWMTAAMPLIGLNYYLTFFVLNMFDMARAQLVGLILLSLGAAAAMTLPQLATPGTVAALTVMIELLRALMACAIVRLSGRKVLAPDQTEFLSLGSKPA